MPNVPVDLSIEEIIDKVLSENTTEDEPVEEPSEDRLGDLEAEHRAALQDMLSNLMVDYIAGLKETLGEDILFTLLDPSFDVDDTTLNATVNVDNWECEGELTWSFDVSDQRDDMPTWQALEDYRDLMRDFQSEQEARAAELAARRQQIKDKLLLEVTNDYDGNYLVERIQNINEEL